MLISIKISSSSAFLGSDRPRMLFFLLINVKMPTIVGILTFMGRKKSCSAELSMKILYNLGAAFGLHSAGHAVSVLINFVNSWDLFQLENIQETQNNRISP